MYAQAYQQYRQTQVETAGPGQLVLMLYDGGLKYLDEATAAITGDRLECAHRALVKAQDIVCELMVSLNMEAGELAENLLHLYDYMHKRLVEANIKKDSAIISQVRGMLQELRDTWQEVVRQAGSGAERRTGYDLRG